MVREDSTYRNFYLTSCRKCGNQSATLQHFKWKGDIIYEIGVQCNICNRKFLEEPNEQEINLSLLIDDIKIDTWYPKDKFHNSPSFTSNFISCIGGNHFYNLYTKRNLYVISKIFDYIMKVNSLNTKRHLLFGFIQTIHLCTKMSVPRRRKANRGFSTSWGRSAYICANRKMEMNPLLTFLSSCFGKQSVESSLRGAEKYLGKIPKAVYVDYSNKAKDITNYDIKYGIIDISNISDFIHNKSIDFILTDPPYGDLVQYLDLSSIWLIWLKKIDRKFAPNYNSEIIIKEGVLDFNSYKRKFENAISNLNNVLKDDRKVVFTFHNKKIKIWNMFLHAIKVGGFTIEKVIHQQNRRTGEANVANPYGTSANDFYIRCSKGQNLKPDNDRESFDHYVLQTAIRLIALRNEPTPYQILYNGILAEISFAGFELENFDLEIKDILSKEIGSIFELRDNKINKAGAYWWFKNPEKYIKYPDRKLGDRLEHTISRFLRRKISVNFDDVLKEVFLTYPNGLIPERHEVVNVLEKYAYKSAGKWAWKRGSVEKEITKHTEILYLLIEIGKKYDKKSFVGKREQSEKYNRKKLSELMDVKNLERLSIEKEKKDRIEMIDLLWLSNSRIAYAIEVENTTKFTSGIQRASNLSSEVKKIMVLPDERKDEFLHVRDPLFIDSFRKYNWHYMFYSDVFALKSSKKITEKSLGMFLKKLSNEE